MPHEADASDCAPKPAAATTIYGQHIGVSATALALPAALMPHRLTTASHPANRSRRFTSSTRGTAAKAASGGCWCGPWRRLRWLSCGRGGGALEEEEEVSEEVIMIR